MGAHTAHPATGPSAVARIATTTLAVAVTGVLGAGTALAHDDGYGSGHDGHPGHDGHSDHGGHSWQVDEDEYADHSSYADYSGEAAQARAEAEQTVRDALADMGMSPVDGSEVGSVSAGGTDAAAAAPAPDPSSGPSTSTQPIAAGSPAEPTPLPPAGETTTVPIR